MFKVKVLIVGPCQSGKTVISNFLADATEISSGEYHPTQGVRILEFEVQKLGGRGRQNSIEVELWDCSGDRRFETCWSGMAKDAGGIVFVYNPDQPNHDKELEHLMDFFVNQSGINTTHCVCFTHHKPSENEWVKSRVRTISSSVNKASRNHSAVYLLTIVHTQETERRLNLLNSLETFHVFIPTLRRMGKVYGKGSATSCPNCHLSCLTSGIRRNLAS